MTKLIPLLGVGVLAFSFFEVGPLAAADITPTIRSRGAIMSATRDAPQSTRLRARLSFIRVFWSQDDRDALHAAAPRHCAGELEWAAVPLG